MLLMLLLDMWLCHCSNADPRVNTMRAQTRVPATQAPVAGALHAPTICGHAMRRRQRHLAQRQHHDRHTYAASLLHVLALVRAACLGRRNVGHARELGCRDPDRQARRSGPFGSRERCPQRARPCNRSRTGQMAGAALLHSVRPSSLLCLSHSQISH